MHIFKGYEPVGDELLKRRIRLILRNNVGLGLSEDNHILEEILNVSIKMASYNAMALRDREWTKELAGNADVKAGNPKATIARLTALAMQQLAQIQMGLQQALDIDYEDEVAKIYADNIAEDLLKRE